MTMTEERPKLDAPVDHSHGVRWWIAAVIGVVTLGSGMLIGTLIVGGDDQGLEDEVAALTFERDQLVAEMAAQQERYESDVIRAAGGDLTVRQADMVETANDVVAGWQATDGDLVASNMTPDGQLDYLLEGWVFYVSDGSLQDRIGSYGLNSVRPVGPMVVSDDRVAVFGTHPLGDWLTIMQFTSTGDIEVISVYHL
jgi:hypothetical protein